MKKKPEGIGGWLLVYTLWVLFQILLLIVVIVVYQILDLEIVARMILIGIVLFSILIKLPSAKKINVSYLIILAIIAIPERMGEMTSSLIEDRAHGIGAVMGAVIVSILWILYWNRSKRVRNTFVK